MLTSGAFAPVQKGTQELSKGTENLAEESRETVVALTRKRPTIPGVEMCDPAQKGEVQGIVIQIVC